MKCPQCGHESFSLSTSDVRFSSATSYTAAFVCGGCQWHSPAGIANTQAEAEKIAKDRMGTYQAIWGLSD